MDWAACGCGPICIRLRPGPGAPSRYGFIRAGWKSAIRAAKSLGTSAVTSLISKCSTWNIIWMSWSASRVRWPDPSPWQRGGNADCGREVMTGCSKIGRHGKQSGTRQMIQVLALIKQHGHERVRAAVEAALAAGCSDAAAILHLIAAPD